MSALLKLLLLNSEIMYNVSTVDNCHVHLLHDGGGERRLRAPHRSRPQLTLLVEGELQGLQRPDSQKKCMENRGIRNWWDCRAMFEEMEVSSR